MKRVLLLVVAIVFVLSGQVFAAIVYSGSQNVTLELEGDDPQRQEAVISIAGSPEAWDDFRVVLWFDNMMDMTGMGMARLAIYAPMGMSPTGMMWMGGIIGVLDMGAPVPYALNLAPGDEIGPRSSFVEWASLYDMGVGQFGPDGGYIGLMMPGSAYYGWLRMSDESDTRKGNLRFTFDAWAYAYPTDTPIRAGTYEVEYIAEHKDDSCIKFEDAMCQVGEDVWVEACLGEGGVVETDTFAVTADKACEEVEVTVKAGRGKNSQLSGRIHGIGDDVVIYGFTISLVDATDGTCIFTVKSDADKRTAALSNITFCFCEGATVTGPGEGPYPVLRASE